MPPFNRGTISLAMRHASSRCSHVAPAVVLVQCISAHESSEERRTQCVILSRVCTRDRGRPEGRGGQPSSRSGRFLQTCIVRPASTTLWTCSPEAKRCSTRRSMQAKALSGDRPASVPGGPILRVYSSLELESALSGQKREKALSQASSSALPEPLDTHRFT